MEDRNQNALTPLTQAVEMAAAAEASNGQKRSVENSFSQMNKKQKYEAPSEDEEDFWDSMKSQAISTYQDGMQPVGNHPLQYFPDSQQQDTSKQNKPQEEENSNRKKEEPQQDPQETHSVELQDIDDGVDIDVLNSYGIFYNIYTKEGSQIPDSQQIQQPETNNESIYDRWGGGFGILPFNPS
jgi:Myb-like DNA-binding protein BAS1